MDDKTCELYKLIQDTLSHDKVMARCVLGKDQGILKDYEEFDELRGDPLYLTKWMGNLMRLAGIFLYAKFNQWRTEIGAHPTDKKRPNALYLKRLLAGVQGTDIYFDQASSGLRVLRVLDGVYDSFDMNFLVIKYIIINSQIEAGLNSKKNKRHGLSQLIGFPHEASLRLVCDPDKKTFEKDGYNLAAAFNFVSAYRNDQNLKNVFDDVEEHKPVDIECAFKDVFNAMEFMKRVRLDIDTDGNVNFIETTVNGDEKYIHSHGVARIFETKKGKCTGIYKSGMDLPKNFIIDFYFLERLEYLSDPDPAAINAAIRFLYQSFDESNSVTVYFSEKEGWVPEGCAPEDDSFAITPENSAAECFKRISGYLPYTQSTSSFFRGMIAVHYRYHNVLAPSIVDAIDEDRDAKKRILKRFVREEEISFKDALEPTFKTLEFALGQTFDKDWASKIDRLCEYISDQEYRFRKIIDWDSLMARILIYEGPSEIVKTVLLDEDGQSKIESIEEVCDKIIAGLELRYIDKIFEAEKVSKAQQEDYENYKRRGVTKIEKYFPGEYAAKIKCKALAQSYIDTIVKTLAKIEKKDNEGANNKFAENNIQDTLGVLEEYEQARSSFNTGDAFFNAFLRTIKAFLSFYAGIFSCCRQRLSYEFEKSITILSLEAIEERKRNIEGAFFKGVSETAVALSKLFRDKDAIESALRELWDFAKKSKEDPSYYSAVLARAPINSKALAQNFKINDNNTIIFKPEEKDEIDFGRAVEDGEIIEHLGNIIRFLAFGDNPYEKKNKEKKIDIGNYVSYKEYAKKVIYPQIVTFVKHREDSDANHCLIMDHSGAFAEWHKGGVQILTEFKYEINHSYYAMPNLNRIETEWWVDPIMVSCYKFDETINEASNNAEVRNEDNK